MVANNFAFASPILQHSKHPEPERKRTSTIGVNKCYVILICDMTQNLIAIKKFCLSEVLDPSQTSVQNVSSICHHGYKEIHDVALSMSK